MIVFSLNIALLTTVRHCAAHGFGDSPHEMESFLHFYTMCRSVLFVSRRKNEQKQHLLFIGTVLEIVTSVCVLVTYKTQEKELCHYIVISTPLGGLSARGTSERVWIQACGRKKRFGI